ncbi:MAG: hypothetical protein ACI8UD_004286 [Planctomycetota bacterium]|jgi:hypothetical protein
MRSLFLPLAAALAVAALPAQTLTTTFAGGNGQAGNMFDLQAVIPVTITGFDVNLDAGTWDMEVYTLAPNLPYLPDVANPTAWTLVGSTTGLLSLGANVPTPLPIALSVPIAAGEVQAFYVTVTNGTAINYTNGTTTGALFASTPQLQFFEGAGVAYPFAANFNPRNFNANIHYTFAAGFATKEKYGSPCDFPSQFGEHFAQGAPVDLANTSWLMIDTGGGTWDVSQTAGFPYDAATPQASGIEIRDPTNPWFGAFTSSSCACWDDATVVMTPVTGGLTYPDPATGLSVPFTQISINTNGTIRVGDQGADNSFAYNGGNSGFVSSVFQGTAGPLLPQFALFFNDLDLDAAGSLWVEDNGGQLRITWDGVPNWDAAAGVPSAMNDLQITFIPGLVIYSFGPNVGNGGSASNEGIVGWSQGDGSTDNRLDWTVDMTAYTSGSGFVGPSTDATAPPVLGTSFSVVVDGLSPTAIIGGVVYGLTQLSPGIPLGGLLGINCDLLASTDLILLGVPVAGTYTDAPFAVPLNPVLSGSIIAAQGFALDASLIGPSANEVNPLGATLGDAVLLTIGT